MFRIAMLFGLVTTPLGLGACERPPPPPASEAPAGPAAIEPPATVAAGAGEPAVAKAEPAATKAKIEGGLVAAKPRAAAEAEDSTASTARAAARPIFHHPASLPGTTSGEAETIARMALRVEGVGFQTPESVLHDEADGFYLVSNINGSPLAADGNGFISRLHVDGSVAALEWIDGTARGVTLNAPKGMAFSEGLLYVADLDHVRLFDRHTGRPSGAIAIEGATFLNDLVPAPGGGVWVSDTGMKAGPDGGLVPSGTDAIYRIDAAGEVSTLVKDPSLGRPNGLLHYGGKLWVVTFGTGEMYAIEGGRRVLMRRAPAGALDGVAVLRDGRVVVSSWESSTVYAGSLAGTMIPLVEGVKAPADIGVDDLRGRLLIPLFEDDAVLIQSL